MLLHRRGWLGTILGATLASLFRLRRTQAEAPPVKVKKTRWIGHY